MQYATIPFVGKSVPRLVFGTAVPYIQWGGDCDALFDAALAAGVTAFDTARCYMRSENVLGGWMERRGVRDKIVLITKGGLDGMFGVKRLRDKCIRADLQASMSALKTDFIDLYFLHRDDPSVPAGEIVERMNALIAEGKIGAYGASNWTHERIEAAQEYAYRRGLQPFSASQPHFGLAEAVREPWKGCLSLTGAKQAAARAWYARTGLAVLAYSPLGRGMLSGKFKSGDAVGAKKAMDGAARRGFLSAENMERLRRTEEIAAQTGYTVPQLALAWALGSEMNVFAVAGTSRVQGLEGDLSAIDIVLTPAQRAYMDLKTESL